MAPISIRDSLNAEIVSANPQVNSGLGKYLKGTSAQLLAGADFAGQFRKELLLVNPGESGFGLSFSGEIPLGHDKVSLTVAAGAKAVIGVYNRTRMQLFENTFIGEPLTVPAGQAYVSFSFRPSLEVGLQQEVGNLSFGLTAGTEGELRCYRPFDVTGAPVTLAGACKSVLETFTIPNTVADLKQMADLPSGTIACVSGHGHLQVGCSVDVAAAFNPLASVATLSRLGNLTISGGASVSAGFQATVSGDFQMRVQKMDGRMVRLSYHKVAARELDISVGAKAGTGVTLGDRDLLKMLFGGPGGLSGTSEEDLVSAGISKAQLDRMTSVMKAGMSRKLELALSAQFSSMRQDEAAFLYELDLDAIDGIGEGAVNEALAGDLAELNRLESELPGHGIRVLQSRIEKLKKKTVSWRVNLVGIVNILSMSELVRTGTVFHDEESGELVITDQVTTERMGAVTQSRNLRKLLYESAVMTLTYKASGLDVNTGLSAAQSFFFLDSHANRQRVSDYLDAVAAVGLIEDRDVDSLLGGENDFGKSSLLLETTFNQAACERLFGDTRERRDQAFFENVGRGALLALVQERDPDAYRRIPMRDGALWKTMKDTGQPGFQFILPPPITGGDEAREALRVAIVAADYSLIVWWAEAMATAAERLSAMREFLNGRHATSLNENDPEFRKKRTDLENAVAKSIRRNQSSFDDPWGLVALFMASTNTATATAAVVSPRLTLFLPE